MNPTRKDIEALVKENSRHCISIYLPTHKKGVEVKENLDSIQLKNHLLGIKHALMETEGLKEEEVSNILKNGFDLVENTDFWHHQSEGLAIFINDNGFFNYFRLPYHVEPFRIITDSFHLQELIPVLNRNHLYYILGLDLNGISLWEATENYIHEIDLAGGAPQKLADILHYYQFENKIEGRSPVSSSPGYQLQAGEQDEKPYLKEYFDHVHDGVSDLVEDLNKNYVVLAGVEYLQPIFKEVNKKLKVTERGIKGNPHQLKQNEIHQRSWQVVGEKFEASKKAYVEKLHELVGTGKASEQAEEIVPAAMEGRVKALLVDPNTHIYGEVNQNDLKVTVHEQFKKFDHCLNNDAAVQTLLHNGEVFFEKRENFATPENRSGLGAIFRY